MLMFRRSYKGREMFNPGLEASLRIERLAVKIARAR